MLRADEGKTEWWDTHTTICKSGGHNIISTSALLSTCCPFQSRHDASTTSFDPTVMQKKDWTWDVELRMLGVHCSVLANRHIQLLAGCQPRESSFENENNSRERIQIFDQISTATVFPSFFSLRILSNKITIITSCQSYYHKRSGCFSMKEMECVVKARLIHFGASRRLLRGCNFWPQHTT